MKTKLHDALGILARIIPLQSCGPMQILDAPAPGLDTVVEFRGARCIIKPVIGRHRLEFRTPDDSWGWEIGCDYPAMPGAIIAGLQIVARVPAPVSPQPPTRNRTMKINRSAQSESSADEILDFLRGGEDTIARRQDAVVSISDDGDLLFYNAACGTDDSETVLIDRLEADSMGDGWDETATAEELIEWLESNRE